MKDQIGNYMFEGDVVAYATSTSRSTLRLAKVQALTEKQKQRIFKNCARAIASGYMTEEKALENIFYGKALNGGTSRLSAASQVVVVKTNPNFLAGYEVG